MVTNKYEWLCDMSKNVPVWYMFRQGEEDAIAEVGMSEDDADGYYWVELENETGYYGYDTLDEAKAAVEAYFNGYLV